MSDRGSTNGQPPSSRPLEEGVRSEVRVEKNSQNSSEDNQEKVETTDSINGGDQVDEEDTPVDQIQLNLDELSYSGTAINELEVQLMRHRELYHRALTEGRQKVDYLAKKLNSHIMKSEPFVHMWRKAKEVQEKSNKAAARYDKANSQHAAAKEMIRVAESQLEERLQEMAKTEDSQDSPSSPSPLDAAWQEMLNHATAKVVLTEKERRDSEVEHRKVLEECTRVMEEYRATEKRLRTHITKSRPYYEARFKTNQQLMQIKKTVKELEEKISKNKLKYSASLRRLDLLSTEMHIRRGTMDSSHLSKYGRGQRQVLSTGSSPVLRHNGHKAGREDVVSVDSLQLSEAGGYGGSVDSLPSLNTEEDLGSNDKLHKSFSSSHSSSSHTSHPRSSPLPLEPPSSDVTPPLSETTPPSVLVSPSSATSHLSSSTLQPSPTTPTTPTPSSHSRTLTSSSTTPSSSATPTSSVTMTTSLATSSSSAIPQVTPHSTMAASSLDSSPSSSATMKSSLASSSSFSVPETKHRGSCDIVSEPERRESCDAVAESEHGDSRHAVHDPEEMARELVEESLLKALSQIHPAVHSH